MCTTGKDLSVKVKLKYITSASSLFLMQGERNKVKKGKEKKKKEKVKKGKAKKGKEKRLRKEKEKKGE